MKRKTVIRILLLVVVMVSLSACGLGLSGYVNRNSIYRKPTGSSRGSYHGAISPSFTKCQYHGIAHNGDSIMCLNDVMPGGTLCEYHYQQLSATNFGLTGK